MFSSVDLREKGNDWINTNILVGLFSHEMFRYSGLGSVWFAAADSISIACPPGGLTKPTRLSDHSLLLPVCELNPKKPDPDGSRRIPFI
jgi:hypothetical protein